MSSALWWVVNGRAAAPPRSECIIGVSTSRKPRASRNSRMCATSAVRAAEDLAHLGVGDQVEVALAVAGLDVGQAVPLLGQRAQRLGERQELGRGQRSARRSWSGRACPSPPTKSPRSVSLKRSNWSPSASFFTWIWSSPLRSRILMKAALPKLRRATIRPAME